MVLIFFITIPIKKHLNMYKLILLLSFTFLFNTTAQSQTQEELILEINQLINSTNLLKKRKRKKMLKKVRVIAYQDRENKEDMAVINTRIGMSLSQKGMYKNAREFYEYSWEIRKKHGEIFKQKWPLRALVENGIRLGDIEYAMKYSIERIKLIDNKREELQSDWEREKGYSTEKTFFDDLLYFVRAIYDYDQGRSKLMSPASMELKHRLFLYCMEEHRDYQEELMKIALPYYIHVVRLQLYTHEDLKAAKMWADRAIDLIDADYMNKDFSEGIISISYCFNGKGYDHQRTGLKPGYADAGIAVAQRYVEMKYKMEGYDDALFGTRYIAKQYGELGEYNSTIQYLADAIKMCNNHNLEEKIMSTGGLHIILRKIKKAGDRTVWEKAKKWKKGYDLKYLTAEDIQRIDRIILEYPVR
ncbi:MAG: hypothetical protein ACI94Y_004092 [Maribacter sp.]|jgi:hypothetical protein